MLSQDSQNFQIGHLLSQRGIQAGAALLDKPKVESRRVGNRLQMIGDGAVRVQSEVVIVPRNGGVLTFGEIRDGVLERVPEIGILGIIAVARPPSGVHGELLQVGEPSRVRHPCNLAGRQNGKAKATQVNRRRAL